MSLEGGGIENIASCYNSNEKVNILTNKKLELLLFRREEEKITTKAAVDIHNMEDRKSGSFSSN